MVATGKSVQLIGEMVSDQVVVERGAPHILDVFQRIGRGIGDRPHLGEGRIGSGRRSGREVGRHTLGYVVDRDVLSRPAIDHVGTAVALESIGLMIAGQRVDERGAEHDVDAGQDVATFSFRAAGG